LHNIPRFYDRDIFGEMQPKKKRPSKYGSRVGRRFGRRWGGYWLWRKRGAPPFTRSIFKMFNVLLLLLHLQRSKKLKGI
jgi:hypothetical protein